MEGNKSYIQQIANMLGVEINEEFKIRPTEYGKVLGCKEIDKVFRFDTELVYKGYNDGWSEWWGHECDKYLYYLILGKYEIVKISDADWGFINKKWQWIARFKTKFGGDYVKIIFLDVDGELTYSNYQNRETANIDIEKVKLVKEICDKTGAKVVISSSWRGSEDYTPKIYYVLIEILSKNDIKVLGDTPYLKTEIIGDVHETISLEENLDLKCKYGTGRAAEIQKWINEHEVESFVILDDEDWQWSDYGYENNWIQPTWFGDGGLKREHVDMAINILNK